MRMIDLPRKIMGALAALLMAITGYAVSAEEQPFGEQHLWIGDNLVLSGLLDLQALKDSFPGTVLIVDLRTAAEGTAEEQAAAAAFGMDYRNIPVAGVAIVDDQVAELDGILSQTSPDSLVVLHCASGHRAGMLWAANQINKGQNVDDLLEQLAPLVTKEPVIDAIRTFAGGQDTAH